MIIKANSSHIDTLLEFKRKMVIAMQDFDSPVRVEEIDFVQLKEKLLKDLEDENFYFMLYSSQDKYIAYIIFNIVKLPVLIDDKYILNISNVYTDTKHRKKGYAQELINHAIEIAKEKNCVQVELSVLKGNPAKGLYEKMGFQTLDYNMLYQISP